MSSGNGGGVYCSSNNSIITNVTITGNLASGDGGGIYCDNSSPSLDNVTISGNTTVEGGGGIFCVNQDHDTTGYGSLTFLTRQDWASAQDTMEERMRIDQNGKVYIGDTSNSNLSLGLTINQGAADDHILALKSSDVSHGWTALAEADTWGGIEKAHATQGGVKIEGFGSSGAGSKGIELVGYTTGGDTNPSTGAMAPVNLVGVTSVSSNDVANASANELVLSVQAYKDGGYATVFTVDEDGDIEYDGSDAGAYDSYDDAQLVRAVSTQTASPEQLIQTKFDDYVKYNKDTLIEAGLLGDVSEEDKKKGHRGLVNLTGMQRLHNGAIWQQYTEMQKMKELMYDTMVELIGKEKADQKLKDHDVKLLDENTLLN